MRPDNPDPVKITPRNEEIIRQVAKNRYLSSDSVCVAVRHLQDNARGVKDQRIRRNLTKLWRAGYLDKPPHQFKYFGHKNITRAHIYGLTSKGGKVVQKHFKKDLIKPRWTQKNAEAHHDFIHHTAGIGDFAVRIEAGAREIPGIFSISENDMLKMASPDIHSQKNPWRFRVRLKRGRGHDWLGIQPDKVFGIGRGYGEDAERLNFVLEYDRDSETVIQFDKIEKQLHALEGMLLSEEQGQGRKTMMQKLTLEIIKTRADLIEKNAFSKNSNFIKKMICYFESFRASEPWHKEKFGWQNYRVLTVTMTDSHIKRFQEALQIVTQGRLNSMFLFATEAQTQSAENVLMMDWQDGAGKKVLLARGNAK